MNKEMYKQILKKFPALITLIEHTKLLPLADKTFYRDMLAMSYLVNTSDGEVLGALQCISYKLNKELDKLNERRML